MSLGHNLYGRRGQNPLSEFQWCGRKCCGRCCARFRCGRRCWSMSRSRCRRSRHDLNGGEFRVVDSCRCDNVEHSVCDRDNERSLHRGKLSGYRPDIKILENSLPFYASIKYTLPGGVEIYFSKVERDRVRVVNDWDVVREDRKSVV